MKPVSTNQLVKQVGQYLYKHIDGAYKAVSSSNTYDVYVEVYYQLPREQQVPGKQSEGYNDMHTMKININLTTYQNKIRVNIHELTPNQWTFSYMIIPPEKLQDVQQSMYLIYNKVLEKIKKHYKDYIFLF